MFKKFFSLRPAIEAAPKISAEVKFGRKLRMFDFEMIAPFDHRGLIAFLHADKLSELTHSQIRIFLLLRDNSAPEGLTASEIAAELDMSAETVSSCVRAFSDHAGSYPHELK